MRAGRRALPPTASLERPLPRKPIFVLNVKAPEPQVNQVYEIRLKKKPLSAADGGGGGREKKKPPGQVLSGLAPLSHTSFSSLLTLFPLFKPCFMLLGSLPKDKRVITLKQQLKKV